MFSVKFPHISIAMAQDKIERLIERGADTVVANDCGYLMQLGGTMHRQRVPIQTRHRTTANRPIARLTGGFML